MNQKILFVDDEPAALSLYSGMLKGKFAVWTAVSSEDGLAMLHNLGPFALVISHDYAQSVRQCESGSRFIRS